MRTSFVVVVGLLFLVLIETSCGGGTAATSTASAAVTTQTTNTTTPTPTITFPTVQFDYVSYTSTGLPPQYANTNVAGADNTPATNPITNPGANLGRVLFYDKKLSANDTVSCSSCHHQSHGFSDPATLSFGFQGGHTDRHAMGLTNARYYQRGHFFWDERAATLEAQVLQPIQNAVEMGMTLTDLQAKLAATTYYPPLFQAAFGTTDVTSDRISKALAQFVRSMVSYQSKYDQAFAPGAPPNFAAVFTAQELRGQQLFGSAGCVRCHGTDAHIAANIQNNGLDAVTTDVGAGHGQFKAPSLRNIGARGPFMHDGRFATLDEVIEFYNSGVQDNPDLSPLLRVGNIPTGPVRRLNFTAHDKTDLKAFLLTLTDPNFMNDPKFASPF